MIVQSVPLKLLNTEKEKQLTERLLKTKLIPLHCEGFFVMNLTEIAQHHDEWVRIVKRFGAKTEAEDIVQDMYIRFHKYGKGQVITKSFIWIMLRNIFFDYCKREISMVDIDLMVDLSEDENNKTYEVELYYQSVEEQIKTWEWFDQQLFLLYLRSGKSMRELEKETKISLTSIFHTIKKCKRKLRAWQKQQVCVN